MSDKNENILTNLGSDFTKELNTIAQQVLIKSGVKANSELVDSVEWQYSRDSLLMYVNEYYESLSKGRQPLKKKIPIQGIIKWIKTNNITSSKYPPGQLAFVIQRSIYLHGIRGKNFIDQVQNTVSDRVEIEVANDLEDLISESLFVAFTVKK